MVCQTPDGQRRLTDGVTKWHYVERRMAHWRGRYYIWYMRDWCSIRLRLLSRAAFAMNNRCRPLRLRLSRSGRGMVKNGCEQGINRL